MSKYKGTIIQESLTDDRILNEFDVVGLKVTKQKKSEDRWHLFTVLGTQKSIEKLSKYLKPEKWYAHFWKNDDVIVIFPDKVFHFKYSVKDTWKEAIKYGKTLGIHDNQLDFLIDE